MGYASKPIESMHIFESTLGQNVNSTSVISPVHSIAKIKTDKIIIIHCESELLPLKQVSQGKDTQQESIVDKVSAKLKYLSHCIFALFLQAKLGTYLSLCF